MEIVKDPEGNEHICFSGKISIDHTAEVENTLIWIPLADFKVAVLHCFGNPVIGDGITNPFFKPNEIVNKSR